MGKTRLTFRNWIQEFRDSDLDRYRRALRRQDQQRLNSLLDDSERFSMPAKSWNPDDPRHAVWLNLCLAQQREIDALRERVAELEARLDSS